MSRKRSFGHPESKNRRKSAFASKGLFVNLIQSLRQSLNCSRVLPSMPSTLAELPIGTDAIVQAMPTGRSCLTRLREMGIVPGTRVRVTRRAPLGEPIEISVRGSQLSMRNHEAAFIAIAPVAA
jgi:Fe2+ transport system protein FeoA